MKQQVDLAVVGGGIVGLAHATLAARAGLRVVVFERSPRAMGASIRNFGMVWPVGQQAGEAHSLALRSREIWGDILGPAGISVCGTGSLHAARAADEMAVLEEFAAIGPRHGYPCEMLSAAEAHRRSPGLRRDGLLGALFSPTELIVDPREAVSRLTATLDVRRLTAVTAIDPPFLLAGGDTWQADRIVVCGGDDLATLYPGVFAESGIVRCKLQMLRTAPQPDGWQLGVGLAAGLTLRFYPAFQLCESMLALAARIAAQSPEYDRWGIHVLVSQTARGEITIGDSHEYGDAVDPFDKPEIDDCILRYFQEFVDLPDPRIVERWHGVYAKLPGHVCFRAAPHPSVRLVTATGGSGMTLSFAIAEQTLQEFGA